MSMLCNKSHCRFQSNETSLTNVSMEYKFLNLKSLVLQQFLQPVHDVEISVLVKMSKVAYTRV